MNNAPASPQHLGKYELLAEIGRGGFGTVFLARDPGLQRDVALKVLDPQLARDADLVKNFLREARAAGSLHHTNIVTVYDAGEDQGSYYIAMRYLSGLRLSDVIAKESPMPVERVVEILGPVADALDYAHSKGFVHRDVKPGNVILDEDGRPGLVDFGLVHAASGTSYISLSGRMPGTVQYCAPEQLSSKRIAEVSPATDVYALGIVAYQMLTGKLPFDGDTTAVLGSQVNDPPPPPRKLNPAIPEIVEAVILQALLKQPEMRPQKAGAFLALLRGMAAPTTPLPITFRLPEKPLLRLTPVTLSREVKTGYQGHTGTLLLDKNCLYFFARDWSITLQREHVLALGHEASSGVLFAVMHFIDSEGGFAFCRLVSNSMDWDVLKRTLQAWHSGTLA